MKYYDTMKHFLNMPVLMFLGHTDTIDNSTIYMQHDITLQHWLISLVCFLTCLDFLIIFITKAHI